MPNTDEAPLIRKKTKQNSFKFQMLKELNEKTNQVERTDAQLDSTIKLFERIRLVGQVLSDIQHILTVPVG